MEKHDKLVRDKIPAKIEDKGEPYSAHEAGPEEYLQALDDKLMEEVKEYLQTRDAEELADIITVIEAIAAARHDLSPSKLYELEENKSRLLGRFANRIILEES